MDLNNNLKAIRKNMRISGEEVASRAGIAYSTYLQIESGKSEPRLTTALKIAKALKTKIEVLFNLKGNK